MNELALFAGGGGGILGGKLLGWNCICAVEIEQFCRDILMQRQDDGFLPPFPIWDDICSFDGKPWRGLVDVVSGGFPCQDISAAGGGAGIDGERSGLWSEMARVISEVRPSFVFVENSPMLVGRGLAVVLGDLASLGYDAIWGIVGAHHVGAPHKRDRIWILAYSDGAAIRDESRRLRRQGGQSQAIPADHGAEEIVADGRSQRSEAGDPETARGSEGESRESDDSSEPLAYTDSLWELQPERDQPEFWRWSGDSGEQMADAPSFGLQEGGITSRDEETLSVPPGEDWWAAEPDVGRVAHGVAARVGKLRALGNGQVPAVAARAWTLLIDSAARSDV